MEPKEKDVVLVIQDKVSFGDSLGKPSINKESPIKGHVTMYEIVDGEKKLIFEKSNLVVYLGREWVNSRTFNIDNANIDPVKEEFICWAGLGSGGTVIGDPFDPAPPSSSNTDLNEPIMINLTDNINCGDLRVTPVNGYYKHKLDEVIFEQDINNASAWIITRVQIIIGQEDANNQLISEAGLFTATSNAGGYSGTFHLFARVTFPSIYKDSSRQLILIWYLYY